MVSPNDTWENLADGFIVKFNGLSTISENFEIVAADLCIKENGIFTAAVDPDEIKNISWNFGDPASGPLNHSASIAPTHTYNTAGLYKVKATITDINNKTTLGSVIFEVHSPADISLGNDFALCSGTEKRIELTSNAEWTYAWQDGSTAYFNNIKQSGKYWVSVSDMHCTTTDTLNVTDLSIPEFELDDRTLCPGEEYLIDLSDLDASIQWSDDGSTNELREISNAGLYTATASNPCGSNSQSFTITVIQPLNLPVENGIICGGQSYRVDLSEIDATISWNDGDTALVKSFENEGTYSVEISNQCEQKSANFTVTEIEPLKVDLGKDIITCSAAKAITFEADQPGATYLWSDGSTLSSITAQHIGIYWVDVTNPCETVRDSIAIKYIDPTEIVIPNVITPNGDPTNEFFAVDEQFIGSSLYVFNRWGQNVYSTNYYNNDWNAENLEGAVYYYTIPEYCLRGWIHVLK